VVRPVVMARVMPASSSVTLAAARVVIGVVVAHVVASMPAAAETSCREGV
jgi:hypothetical protein